MTAEWTTHWAAADGGHPLQLLAPDGQLVRPDLPCPSDDLVREALRLMLLSRARREVHQAAPAGAARAVRTRPRSGSRGGGLAPGHRPGG